MGGIFEGRIQDARFARDWQGDGDEITGIWELS